jgi:hypothetical protein
MSFLSPGGRVFRHERVVSVWLLFKWSRAFGVFFHGFSFHGYGATGRVFKVSGDRFSMFLLFDHVAISLLYALDAAFLNF